MATKDTIDLATICQQLKVAPRLARIRLRAAEFRKPDGGSWVWPANSKDIAAAKEVIRGKSEPSKPAPKVPVAKKSAKAPAKAKSPAKPVAKKTTPPKTAPESSEQAQAA
jgi:hypothetical protein